MIRSISKAVLCLILCPLLEAQQVFSPAMTSDAIHNSASSPAADATHAVPVFVTIPKDTLIWLVALEAVNSATATKGQLVRLAVNDDVIVNGLVVIPKGTLATAEVTKAVKGVPQKRNGNISIYPIKLILNNGTRIKLREVESGVDPCGDMGPCWIWWTFLAPLTLESMAENAIKHRHERPAGKNEIMGACSRHYGFTKKQIILRRTELLVERPAPDVLLCIDRSFPDVNRVRQ
jgi:hypothetical protein